MKYLDKQFPNVSEVVKYAAGHDSFIGSWKA